MKMQAVENSLIDEGESLPPSQETVVVGRQACRKDEMVFAEKKNGRKMVGLKMQMVYV